MRLRDVGRRYDNHISYHIHLVGLLLGGDHRAPACESDESVMLSKPPQRQQILRGSLVNCDREQWPPLLLLFNTDRTDLKENVLLRCRPAALRGKQK